MAIFCFVIIIYIYIKRNKQLYSSVNKEESPQAMSPRYIAPITNGLCVIVTIGDYQTFDPQTKIKNIPIDKDNENLRQAFNLFNYNIIPSQPKAYWDEQAILSFLDNDVMNELVNDDDDELRYDGLIVRISGHGTEHFIVTSDHQYVEKSAIHRIFGIKSSKIREIPRIFIFDACNGQATRTEIDTINDSSDDNSKCFRLTDLPNQRSWTTKDKNPDFNLVEIHASNIGFQSKYNQDNGSYLLYEFAKRITEYTLNNKKEELGRTFEKIQNDLHDRGKQQIMHIFNNNTRYLELHVNRNTF